MFNPQRLEHNKKVKKKKNLELAQLSKINLIVFLDHDGWIKLPFAMSQTAWSTIQRYHRQLEFCLLQVVKSTIGP